ncbi:MAG TPA: outer membrane beta-barrel protein [Verrucomicrobiae bacterium]
MKFNKWTLGLAAVGAVSMASAVRADEAKLSQVQTALSNTTISGYVDVSVNYVAGSQPERGYYNYPDYRDQFSLDTVTISLDKPLDDSPWASGYHIDLNAGNRALNALYSYTATQGLAVRQAYVTLRTPVGNGIDWKVGAMDGVTGYEGNTAWANPNYSRSFGYAINPASYVGLIGTYKICDAVSFTGGLLNRGYMMGYGQNDNNLSSFDYLASVSLTAPDSWGFLKGSSLNLQTIQGFDNNAVDNYSINGTLSTPLAGLKVGFAWDRLQSLAYGADGDVWGLYSTFQATDKLSFALRGEIIDSKDLYLLAPTEFAPYNSFGIPGKGEEITATVAYNLWANVLTRAEIRWDHAENGPAFATNGGGEGAGVDNQFTFVLNVVYKF